MSDSADRLARAIAFDRAYQVAGHCLCRECGLPATKMDPMYCDPMHCDEHATTGEKDSCCAPAIRRLLRIARGE